MGYIKNKNNPKLRVIYHPNEFADGTRILMLTTRSKEGGRTNNPDRQASNKKHVTRSIEEYYQKLDELLEEMNPTQRIYSTVDSRDIEKAIRIFKGRQLEADYYDTKDKHGFYVDVYNRWISSLQSPQARGSQLFLYDIDDDGDNEDVYVNDVMFACVKNNIEILTWYETKNGFHVITEPHNPILVPAKHQKNAMLLVAYYTNEKNKQTELPKVELTEYKGRT